MQYHLAHPDLMLLWRQQRRLLLIFRKQRLRQWMRQRMRIRYYLDPAALMLLWRQQRRLLLIFRKQAGRVNAPCFHLIGLFFSPFLFSSLLFLSLKPLFFFFCIHSSSISYTAFPSITSLLYIQLTSFLRVHTSYYNICMK